MRPNFLPIAFVVIVTLAIISWAQEDKGTRGLVHFVKHRAKPREVRGYKPDRMQTAIGYGKREQDFEKFSADKNDRILIALLRNLPQSVSEEQMIRDLHINPKLRRNLMEADKNEDRDTCQSTELYKSESSISIF